MTMDGVNFDNLSRRLIIRQIKDRSLNNCRGLYQRCDGMDSAAVLGLYIEQFNLGRMKTDEFCRATEVIEPFQQLLLNYFFKNFMTR
jgi:hypothetical protein